jgi:gluconolactonase
MEMDGFGSPPRQVAAINGPGGIVAEPDGSLIVGSGDGITNGVAGDAFPTASLVRVDPASGNVSTFASGLGMANGVARAADGTLYATNDFGFDYVHPI